MATKIKYDFQFNLSGINNDSSAEYIIQFCINVKVIINFRIRHAWVRFDDIRHSGGKFMIVARINSIATDFYYHAFE